jgi:hypothetical protein
VQLQRFEQSGFVERDSFWKEELLEPLSLFEGRLHPEVSGAWQNAFCEGQDALYLLRSAF